MSARLVFAISIVALYLTGCSAGPTITVDGILIYERYWNEAAVQVTQRATFDLNCPADQIELTLLSRINGRYPTEIGATGCGQRARYLLVAAPSLWVLQSRSTENAPASSAAPEPSYSDVLTNTPPVVPVTTPPAAN